MSVRYGYRRQWRGFDGGVTVVAVSGFSTPDEAKNEALKMANEMGWRPARWWEFWRWGEQS